MKAFAPRALLTVITMVSAGLNVRGEDGSKVYLNGLRSSVMVHNVDRRTQGSGSVVNLGDGYILTNWHVVLKGTKMLVVFPMWDKESPIVESERYRSQIRRIGLVAEIVATDEKVDLAVIKINEPEKIPKGTEAVTFASGNLVAGTKIYSIGNPGASDAMWIYTPGEVRAVYKKKWRSFLDGKAFGNHEVRIIEATSPTNPGDSGGPCFNDKCEQVGVTQGGLDAKVAQGFNYFIDASEVKTFLRAKKISFNPMEAMTAAVEEKKEPELKVEPKKEEPKADTAADLKAKLEKAASNNLNLIRPTAKDPTRKEFAAKQLRKLIEQYPNTEAAKEAQDLLNKLQ